MLKPIKECFVICDLYRVDIRNIISKAFPLEKAPGLNTYIDVKKGTRIVYCQTDRKNAGMGWYYENKATQGHFQTRCEWAHDHPEYLTEPKLLENERFR
jgi:hypothetical protein